MRKTNGQVILEHLMDFGTITTFEAFTDYGITRLSAVIFNLKRDGYVINTKTIHGVNRRGTKIKYAQYELVDEVRRK